MNDIEERVYALASWSIKRDGENFRIAPTTYYGAKPEWSKPYASLQAATGAISRKLAEEYQMRHKRILSFHRKKRRAA